MSFMYILYRADFFFQFDYFTINFLTVYIVPSILWVIAAVFLGRVCASVDTASLSVFVKTLLSWSAYLSHDYTGK